MMIHERTISILLLASILILLLLRINFSIWDTTYYRGDLEDQVRQELQLIEETGKFDSEISELFERMQQIFAMILAFTIGILFVSCSFDAAILRKADSIIYPDTLVARSVRLND